MKLDILQKFGWKGTDNVEQKDYIGASASVIFGGVLNRLCKGSFLGGMFFYPTHEMLGKGVTFGLTKLNLKPTNLWMCEGVTLSQTVATSLATGFALRLLGFDVQPELIIMPMAVQTVVATDHIFAAQKNQVKQKT